MHNLLVESFSQVRRDVQNVYDWLKFLYSQNTHQQRLLEDQNREIGDLKRQINLMPQNKEEVKALIDAYYDVEPIIKHVEEMEKRVRDLVALRPPEISVPEVAEQVQEHLSNQVTNRVDEVQKELSRQIEAIRKEVHEELEASISARLEALEPKPQEESEAMKGLNQRLGQIQEELEKLGRMRERAPEPQIRTVAPMPARTSSALKEKLMRSLTRNSKEYIKNTILNLIKKYQKITGLQLREILVEEQALVSRSSFYRLLGELEQEREDLSVIQHGKEKIYIMQQKTALEQQLE